MARSFQLLPSGDIENDGWTLVGSSITQVWEAVGQLTDDRYIQCPSYRGAAAVSFPIDADDLPEGAIIDSVTVFIRMKTSSGSGPRSVTVNVLSSENMSRYTSRTLYATSAFTTFEVGTYTRDPMGRAWDMHRINKLRLRVYSLNNTLNAINISQLYVKVNYHVKPKLRVTAPTGTSVSPSPKVQWVYTHEDGEPQLKAQVKIFTAEQVSAVNTFNPDTAPAVYDKTFTGSAPEHAIATTLNNNGYRVYVKSWSQHNVKSPWAYRDFIVGAPSPGIPGDDNAGASGTPGVGVPTAVPDSYTSSAQIRMRDASNLLSVQQADFEIASDPLEYTGVNCAIARSTAQAFGDGEASMSMTSSASGDMVADSTFVEISPGVAITLRAQGKKSTAGSRTCRIYATFYDSDFTLLSTSDSGSMTDTDGTWTEVVLNTSTPAETSYAKVHYKVESTSGAGEVHYVDHVGVMYGTNSAWTDGGHQSRNVLTSFLATGDDPASSTDSWAQANVATTAQRVTTSGIGSHGLMTNQITYVGTSAQIAYRSTSTVFTTPTAGTNFTLNKPSGTTANDLLLAFVTSTEHGSIIPPTGWTAVNVASVDDGSTDVALFVLKRTATSSEPSSWTTGKLSASSSRRTAVVIAYTGAAHADDQFIADMVRTDASGAAVHRTGIVNNTDPNAWRVAAFAASDDASGSAYTANSTAPSTVSAAPIRFVSAGSKFVQQGNSSSYTLNRPSGVVSGDLMVASLVLSGEVSTVTAPSGWTLVRRTHREFSSLGNGDAHSGDVTVAIFKRTAGSSEPTSWTGTHSSWGQPKVSQVVAYRNCANASEQFIAEGSNTAANTSKVSTPTVTNTNSRSWRICLFGATTPFQSSWDGGDVSERCDSSSSLNNFPDAVLQFSDSNGQISTGSHKRTGVIDSISNQYSNVPSGNFFAAVGWIGIIKPLAAPPAQGGNETERVDNNNGSSNPWLSTAVYDSNGVIPAGTTSLYGQFSGASANSVASWIGIIRPASGTASGVASAYTNTWVDISEIDESVMSLADNKITVISSFLGSKDGTPLLGVEFSRANKVISEQVAEGSVFNTSIWTKSWATFSIPDGATRIRPIISARDRVVGDTVKFDRVALSLGAPTSGEVPVWRNGTARQEHPIWSRPSLQYTDDTGSGFTSWSDLPGQKLIPPAFRADTAQLAYVDHSVIPLNMRKYRVQTVSYGLLGDVFSSGWGPDSNEVSLSALNWWLKDFADLSTALRMRVKWEDVVVTTDNTAAVYHPLGEDYPVVLTEGYKADSLTLSVYCDRQEEALLYQLLRGGRTLLLQSDTDYAWWVRSVDALEVVNLAVSQQRRTTDPIKLIKVKFVQVKPEE